MQKSEKVSFKWYALYTRPRWEKKVNKLLEQKGIESYCPLNKVQKQWSDRKKKVISPLFTSYVFIQIEESKRDTVFVIDGILNYVFWLGKPAVIRDEDMEVMRNTINQPNTEVLITHLQSGQQLQIQQGAFKGQEALVEFISNQKAHLFLPSLGMKLVISRMAL